MTQRTYKLDELARAAGASARTIRYYVQRGLLPAPQFRGKDTAYDDEHVARLRAIRRLQDAYLPLDAIAAELEGKTLPEIERIADGSAPVRTGHSPVGSRFSSEDRPGPARHPKGSGAMGPWRTWHRVELGPGIELAVADDAPPESRRVFERALEVLQATVEARAKAPEEKR